MDFKFDYLRFSIIPQFEIHNRVTFASFIIGSVLGMQDKLFEFETTKCGGFYDFKFYYHNIYIKVPSEDNQKEGYQVEMTGEGYDYFVEYRKSIDPNFSERQFFSTILSFRELPNYKLNITRLDIAIDDKSYDNKHYLDFETIRSCILDGSVITRFRHRTVVTDGSVLTSPDRETDFIIYEKGSKRNKLQGSTIYLGNRSGTHVRFYDKIAEMSAHGKDYDHNLKHWMRFELQACHDNALAIITRFVSLEPDDFSDFLSKILLNMVRFVDISREKLSSNYFRCPVAKWWAEFLGTVTKSKLVHKKPKVNKYNKAVRYVKNNVSATAFALIKCVGFHNFCAILKDGADEHYNERRHGLIVNDYLTLGNYEIEDLSGVDVYKNYFETDEDFRKFLIEMRNLREETVLKEMNLAEQEQKKIGETLGFYD